MEWSNEVTLEFLKLYQQEPVIWNPKHCLHKNRNAVADAWKKIEGSLSIRCPVVELKKKKESLMATFRPLLNKVKASMKTTSGADVYKPNWFAYETMAKFLQGIYQPRTTANTQELEDVIRVHNSEQNEEEGENTVDEDHRENYDDIEIRSKTANTFKPSPDFWNRKRKGCRMQTIQNRMEDAYKIMKNVCEKPDKDECLLYAELLAKKLRAFDECTRDVLMHEIDNLIFHAKMEKRNQHIQLLPSTSHSNYLFGGVQSNTPTANTHNYPPFSHNMHHSYISLFNPSVSPGESSFSQSFQGDSNSSQPSPAQSDSQPSPQNITVGDQESITVPHKD